MLHLRASSLADTNAIAAAIAGIARSGDLIVLAGEMGAGKTAFAKGFGAALGVTEPITSPTFTLVHSYQAGKLTLHHADIYRLSTLNEVADLALSELLEYDGIVLIEWGDVVARTLGDHLLVRLAPVEDDTAGETDADDADDADGSEDEGTENARSIRLSGVGRAWATRWQQVESAVAAFAC